MPMLDENGKPIEPIKVEGERARYARESREALKKILDVADDQHQIIVICTDLTGSTPTHVHIEGPSKDKVLLYGMLEVARDCASMGGK